MEQEVQSVEMDEACETPLPNGEETAQELQATVAENGTDVKLDPTSNTFQVDMIAVDDIYSAKDSQHDALVNALVDSIEHIGLQNPICVVPNDIEGHHAKYRIVSGRKRYAAFVKLKKETIPAHILKFAETDTHKDARKKLAEYEENIVRNQLSLVELCEHLGQCKKVYEELYPETKQGKASKNKGKDPVTRSLPYILDAERKLGKSRATIGKLLHIYRELIATNRLGSLKAREHPILHRVEELSELAKSKEHIPALVDIMCKYSDKKPGKFYSLHDAQHKLKKEEEKAAEAEAQRKAQEATDGTTSTQKAAPSSGHERNQSPGNGGFPGKSTVNGTSAQNKGHSDSEGMYRETRKVMEGLPLERVLDAYKDYLQQDLEQWLDGAECLHTFSAEISIEHNAVRVVFNSTISQPQDVTDLPSQCPGWGLHNQSIKTCSTCVYNEQCEEAQTVIVCED